MLPKLTIAGLGVWTARVVDATEADQASYGGQAGLTNLHFMSRNEAQLYKNFKRRLLESSLKVVNEQSFCAH